MDDTRWLNTKFNKILDGYEIRWEAETIKVWQSIKRREILQGHDTRHTRSMCSMEAWYEACVAWYNEWVWNYIQDDVTHGLVCNVG